MKCIIVDDEPLAREGMRLNIEEVKFLDMAGEFANAISANSFLAQNPVDLMFLDINMPGITGIDFLKNLTNRPLVIITTAYPEHALEGFQLDVVDYLVKPIRLERFIKAVNKAKEMFDLQKLADKAKDSGSVATDFIYLKSDRKFVKVYFQNIKYIEGMKDYVMVHTVKERILTAMNIKTILDQLPSSIFTRISKSHVINVNYVEVVDLDTLKVGGEELPLGKVYKEEFINNYIRGNLIERR